MSEDNHEEELVHGSGNAKYGVIGLLLFAIAGATYYFTQPAASTAPAAEVVAAPPPAPTPPPAFDDGLVVDRKSVV